MEKIEINLRQLEISPEDKKAIDDFINNMEIPACKRKLFEMKKQKIKEDATENYKRVFCFLSNLKFQPRRVPVQSLQSTLRILKRIQEEWNYIPEPRRVDI